MLSGICGGGSKKESEKKKFCSKEGVRELGREKKIGVPKISRKGKKLQRTVFARCNKDVGDPPSCCDARSLV